MEVRHRAVRSIAAPGYPFKFVTDLVFTPMQAGQGLSIHIPVPPKATCMEWRVLYEDASTLVGYPHTREVQEGPLHGSILLEAQPRAMTIEQLVWCASTEPYGTEITSVAIVGGAAQEVVGTVWDDPFERSGWETPSDTERIRRMLFACKDDVERESLMDSLCLGFDLGTLQSVLKKVENMVPSVEDLNRRLAALEAP